MGRRVWFSLWTSVWIAGCASRPPLSPAEVVRAHVAAVAAGDEVQAMALLSADARARSPLLAAPDAMPAQGSVAELERLASWEGQRDLAVVRTQDGWKLRRGVLALFSAESAEGALLALARAIEARDFQRVVELMPSESRVGASASGLAGLIAGHPGWTALAQAIAAGRVGWVLRERMRAEAVVAVGGEEHRVVMVEEPGGWKVFDVLPRSSYLERR